jgi:hypothetical protein
VEAELEAAGPECIVPGQMAPVRLLGLKVRFYISKLILYAMLLPVDT